MPQIHSVWPLLDGDSRAARRTLLELATAAVSSDGTQADAYATSLDRLTEIALASPEEAKRLLEAAATLVVLAVGVMALEDTADFVREFDEVDFAIEADVFARSVDEMLANPALTERPHGPLGGFPG